MKVWLNAVTVVAAVDMVIVLKVWASWARMVPFGMVKLEVRQVEGSQAHWPREHEDNGVLSQEFTAKKG